MKLDCYAQTTLLTSNERARDSDCEPTWGPEFTFFSDGSKESTGRYAIVSRGIDHLVTNQPEGAKFTYDESDKSNFGSPNGWWFKIKNDGEDGIEVEMTPKSVEFYSKFASDMQDAIFVTAANEHFFPMLFKGGGHINLGLNCFRHDYLLLRNFIVDYLNHAELSLGAMNYDTNNALSFSLMSEMTQYKFLQIIKRYDQQKDPDLDLFFRELNSLLQGSRDDFKSAWVNNRQAVFERNKYTALNFFHGFDEKSRDTERLEIRAVRPQASMNMFIRQIRLFRNRLRYLKNFKQPIEYAPVIKISQPLDPQGAHKLAPPVAAEDALRAFYTYVVESGEKWSDHREYLWPVWLSDGTLTRFEKSQWFRTRQLSNYARAKSSAFKDGRQPPKCRDFLVAP